ncbi:MAG: PorP/SprF family type IX secretion system membrane protein [Chitinophagales bacterium]
MKKILLTIAIIIGISLNAQDFRFSQFDLNPIYMNPAYSGGSKDLRIGVNYRNQWFNVPGKTLPGPLSSYNLTVDKRFGNILIGGLSLNLFQSFKGEGFYKHTHAGLNYSWHMPLKTRNFSLFIGLGLSYNNLSVDHNKLVFSDQISAEDGYLLNPSSYQTPESGNRHYLDASSGFVAKGNLGKDVSGEFSFSVNHLNKPNISLNFQQEGLNRKYSSFGSVSFKLKKNKMYLNPKVMIEIQDPFKTYTFGMNFYVVNRYVYANIQNFSKPLYIGLYYQTSVFDFQTTNSMILTAGHTGRFGKSNTRYQIGASIDMNIGGLNFKSNISGELSMNIILDTEDNLKRKRKQTSKCKIFEGNPLTPL